jgi:hypothetical protein
MARHLLSNPGMKPKFKARRWHDKDPVLRVALQKLAELPERQQEVLMMDLQRVIMKYDDRLIERNVSKFSIRRRWYDKNPYTWLIINSLKYASPELREKVSEFFLQRFEDIKSEIEEVVGSPVKVF